MAELAPRRGVPDETWRAALTSILAAVQIIRKVELAAAEHEAMVRASASVIQRTGRRLRERFLFDCPV